MTPTIEDAVLLATMAHSGKVDKAGQPYILHPLRVMLSLDSKLEKMIGVLHDVVEDTDYTLDGLIKAKGYSEEVLAALECLTRRGNETYEQFIERIMANPLAKRVKLADLEDNLDVRRLPVLGEKDVQRLNKYLRAWQRLKD